MADIIEESKSNRATCRTCREKIEKGVLRFGAETENAFSGDGVSYMWHHLACAAGKMPAKVKEALNAFSGTVPNRAEIDAILANPPKSKGGGKGAAAAYPYAERAATSRSKCLSCDEAIEKGTLRVAVEREVDTGSFVTKGPGYLHPGCAAEFTQDDDLLAHIKANSAALAEADFAELATGLAGEG